MKRFMVELVVVGIMFNAGLLFAQDKNAPQMPEKVRAFLGNLVGTWDLNTEPFQVTVKIEWDREKNFLIGLAEGRKGKQPYSDAVFWHWDGVSDDGVTMYWVAPDMHTSAQCKILSKTLMAGEETGIQAGQTLKNTFQVESDSPDRFVIRNTKTTLGGETQPDWTGVFKRAKGVTRKDFEEYCRLNEGAWVGKTPLKADMPGIGKKGETATAHYDYTIIEDGTGLLGKSYWPGGTNTWLIAYDEENQQIKSIGISPIFGVDSPIIRYKNRIWTCRERAMNPDGTKYEATITGTFSEDGKTMTVTVSGPNGEKVMLTDVWRRMNK